MTTSAGTSMDGLQNWARCLRQWEIPRSVTAGLTDSPWVLPREVFTRRADRRIDDPVGATHDIAVSALRTPGTVLDIGAAAGASSLPLAGRSEVTRITAVDTDDGLLTAFAQRAERAGIPTTILEGPWPDVAEQAGTADVVIAGNVLYNAPDIADFVTAMTARSRRRVIAELTPCHPLTTLNPLWERFHGITRPTRPCVDDCLEALAELGIHPEVHRWSLPSEPEYASFAELVDVVRRRLCLALGDAPEVDRALREMGIDPDCPPDLGSSGRELVTLAWEGRAPQE